MGVPVGLVSGIAKKTTVPLIAAIGILGGFVLGALSRQPEINDLKKQVRQLKKQHGHLVQVVNAQNREIEDLLARYHALKVYQVFQRRDMRVHLQDSLVFQYATADYLQLLISCVESNANPTEAESSFYCAFTRMLAGKSLSVDEMKSVKDYVTLRHKQEIENLVPCDTDGALEDLLRFGESGKGGFGFPKIGFPGIAVPRFGKRSEGDAR